MAFKNPQYLIEPQTLAGRLDEPNLRILDCTVFLHRPRPGDRAFGIESGRARWMQSHIPGSVFADLESELSDRSSRYRFMLAPPPQFAEAMSSYGVSNDSRVVLYDQNMSMWAARVWWNLRCYGFENAAVLNGGWQRWRREGWPTSSEAPPVSRGAFLARPRPGLMATKEEVLASVDQGGACIIDALGPEQYRGETDVYGRPGHIPSSRNVSAAELVDPRTHSYRAPRDLQARFEATGALEADRVITYCGGGIAASSDAFVLTLLGHENVAVYDASLSEWAADPELPLAVGSQP